MVQEDIVRIAVSSLALIPLSFPIQYISNSALRYAYSLILALIIQYYVFGSYMYPIYLQHLIVYAIIRFKRGLFGGLVTFQSVAFLSGYHIYDYLYNYGGWSMNASALLMILVCKYSLLAYNLDDGKATDETLLTSEQLKNRVKERLGFIDFLGYASFLPTCLFGPPLEFNDYKNFMQKREVYAKIASVLKITGVTLLEMLIFVGLFFLGETYVPISMLKTDQFYQESPAFIFCYATACIYLLRCKYYFGWKLSMGAVHASGVSFDGEGFKRINTVDPWAFESTIHAREKISNWNISVQEWLRKGIYQRSSIKSRNLRQLYVFGVSSLWHGFYPAYYISFALWFFQLHIQTLAFKFFKDGKHVLARLYTQSGMLGNAVLAILVTLMWSHTATYFLILETTYCWLLMRSLYFAPQIILVVLALLLTSFPQSRKHKQNKKQD